MGVDANQGASASSLGGMMMRVAQGNAVSSSSSSATKPTIESSGRKRKANSAAAGEYREYGLDAEQASVKAKKPKVKKDPNEEKRLRRYRAKAPSNFTMGVYERATTQRFFVLSRTQTGTPECPEAVFEISGSTGNIYKVTIARQPDCTCPHARGGNQCKHTVFVLKKVLRARDDLVYQLALLSTELRDIFAAAPNPIEDKKGDVEDKNRKPIDSDCPICFEEMDGGKGKEPLVWCKAACGQNIHKQCFDMWAATKGAGGKITCPYCRSRWEVATASIDVSNIKRDGALNKDGYVNVADQLGISTQRDYSTYSRYWSGHPDAYRGF